MQSELSHTVLWEVPYARGVSAVHRGDDVEELAHGVSTLPVSPGAPHSYFARQPYAVDRTVKDTCRAAADASTRGVFAYHLGTSQFSLRSRRYAENQATLRKEVHERYESSHCRPRPRLVR